MLMSNTEFPKWYNGPKLQASTAVNPFTGVKRDLNDVEYSIYAMVINTERDVERMGGVFNPDTAELQSKMAKGIAWFRQHSVDAYFDLID